MGRYAQKGAQRRFFIYMTTILLLLGPVRMRTLLFPNVPANLRPISDLKSSEEAGRRMVLDFLGQTVTMGARGLAFTRAVPKPTVNRHDFRRTRLK
jgi:hypothetical protein